MDDQLKRAEAYYLVAAELRTNAERMIETSFMLSEMADRICEANMRNKPMPQCTRSHPHENMNDECDRLTNLARASVSAGDTNG